MSMDLPLGGVFLCRASGAGYRRQPDDRSGKGCLPQDAQRLQGAVRAERRAAHFRVPCLAAREGLVNAIPVNRWEPTPGIISAALLHAGQEAPRESCGLVIGGEYLPIENLAPDDASFHMDSRAFLEHSRRGGVEAVVHSHVYLPPLASDADRSSCEATGLPWLIVSYPLGTYAVIRPTGFRAPLVGRQFAWGVHDCYGLVRDGLADYAGLSLPD